MKIIVAPLNWGLGHATRMIPIIQSLIAHKAQIHLASDGEALAVLTKAFPTLPATALPSYNIQYKHNSLLQNSLSLAANMIRTIPKEKKAIAILAKAINADVIISDNRYGCYTPETKNIFVTHQLNILTGNLSEKIVNTINRKLLRSFDDIWVPDFKDVPNLAGKLAHGHNITKKTEYIGGLSRFETITPSMQKIDVLVILSGPEPQRTYFEKKLIQQFSHTQLKMVIVRGKPNEKASTNPDIIDFASTSELTSLIQSSKTIISRSGYSTIMDYAALGLFSTIETQIIFVPTPGQPEQNYLAKKFEKSGLAYAIDQKNFDWAAISNQFQIRSLNKIQFPKNHQDYYSLL